MMKFFTRKYNILFFLILTVFACHANLNNATNYYLIVGASNTNVELSTVNDFKKDLAKVIKGEIYILSEKDKLPSKGCFFVLGTPETNGLIKQLNTENKIQLSAAMPGARGGIWHKIMLKNGEKAVVLGGSDVQGFQYAVYDYAQYVLGVDPYEYWTGKMPVKNPKFDLFNFENKTIAPPKVPVLCYFENDVDELANYRGKLLEYDWESYTEMINSLVRLRYNAIQLFDMLGRPEFYSRPEYKTLKPDYQVDVAYVEKMIDYAHEKGMQVAIDFALGYQIHPMDAAKADCWKTYKNDWLQAWRYYLENTPLSKTDIFILRPRHQVWDWKYESSCGESKIEVFNEVYKAFGDLINEYKPNAMKVLVCYSDGMEMWNDGFRPPNDWIVLWSDHGFGEFLFLPNETKGYKFGTYMHAGYWLNHTVHNPYPNIVEDVMKEMFKKYDATNFCLVNGQTFKPFLLNIEGYSAVCNNPDNFSGDAFYKSWTERYLDKESAKYAVASMRYLNQAQENRIGYVHHLGEIQQAVAYLSNAPLARPGKTPVPFNYENVKERIESTARCKSLVEKALLEAEKGQKGMHAKNNFYHSNIYFPVLVYSDLLAFETTLQDIAVLKRKFETEKDTKALEDAKKLIPKAKKELKMMYEHRESGDIDEKWKGWYSIKNRRQNNGFPTMEMLQNIEKNLNKLTL